VSAGSTSISATLAGVTGSTTLTVQASPATLSSIAVTPVGPSILTGATQQFTATGTYSNGSTQNITSQVTWASSSTTVATINANGLATGVFAGSTSISATLAGVTGSTTLTVQASPAPAALAITTISLPDATVNVDYKAANGDPVGLTATGGTPPYTWSLSSGSLPPGLSFNLNTGAISGTPTSTASTTAPYRFTAQVKDAANPQRTATQPLSIKIRRR
jgi:hypothetical protein